jgi:hypothetical protein
LYIQHLFIYFLHRHTATEHGSVHVDQHGLQGIVTVSYKTYRDTYRNTYQISRYVSLVEKVYLSLYNILGEKPIHKFPGEYCLNVSKQLEYKSSAYIFLK